MRQSRIFIVGGQADGLVPMAEAPYDAERVLQDHLAATPDLLPGDQISPNDPRRWLLVKREAAIPGSPDGPATLSLDHLFVDQDGLPTLVECKRSADPRARREVLAQMLDYAANAMAYWPPGRLRLLAEETAQAAGRSPERDLRALLGGEAPLTEDEQEAFWSGVDANLKAGSLRLLFVADAIPRELRRLVEFCNAKMADLEVLAVELKQFVNRDGTVKAFVPRVLGQTEAVAAGKPAGKRKRGSMAALLADYPQRASFERIADLALGHGHVVEPGISNFSVKCRLGNKLMTYAFGKPTPCFQFYFEYLLLGGHGELAKAMEQTLKDLGYGPTGKYTVNLPVEAADEAVFAAIDRLMAMLDAARDTGA